MYRDGDIERDGFRRGDWIIEADVTLSWWVLSYYAMFAVWRIRQNFAPLSSSGRT